MPALTPTVGGMSGLRRVSWHLGSLGTGVLLSASDWHVSGFRAAAAQLGPSFSLSEADLCPLPGVQCPGLNSCGAQLPWLTLLGC